MLLTCDSTEDGKEKFELLTAPWAAPGTIIQIEGAEYTASSNHGLTFLLYIFGCNTLF